MLGLFIPVILVIGVLVLVIVVAIQRSSKKSGGTSDGADVVAYLVLALAMGVAGFALAELVSTAFPADRFVFDPAENLANSLAALVVATPFLIYFWRRQALRREEHPDSAGWTLYLALVEAVFLVAFVTTTVMFVSGLFTTEPATAWTRAIVFGAIILFHEYAARTTPPLSDAGEIRRVVGSAIGLVTGAVGLTGVLVATLSELTGTVLAGDLQRFHPWLAMLVVGAPVWWYRWLRPWDGSPTVPRVTWTVLVSVASLATALSSGTFAVVRTVDSLLADGPPATQQFEFLSLSLALATTGLAVWTAHRRGLGPDGDNPVQVYRYAVAAIGLVGAASLGSTVTIIVFNRSLIVGGNAGNVVALAIGLAISLVVWLGFERVATTGETAGGGWPRRIYTLGVGAFFGLVAAGSLITTLFFLLRRVLDASQTGSLMEPITILVYSGLAAWHLLGVYAREREVTPAVDVVPPFDVTVICSHPGVLATRLPEAARLRVVHRGDDVAVVDDDTADEIVARVANRPSVVWVDTDGFRVAPLRQT